MTVWDLLGGMRRRWYVLVIGALVTAAGVAYTVVHPGVYWTQVDVVFLAPQSARYPNNLTTSMDSLVTTAGAVQRIIDQEGGGPRTSSPAATLVGQGVFDGWSIRLPDSGGQWAHNYARQVLDVQVSGPSDGDVRARRTALVYEIGATVDRMQDEAGVDAHNRITTEPAAQTPSVYYMDGDRRRAAAMALLVGVALTLVAVARMDRWRSRRATNEQEHT